MMRNRKFGTSSTELGLPWASSSTAVFLVFDDYGGFYDERQHDMEWRSPVL